METRRLSMNVTRVVARDGGDVRVIHTCAVEVLSGPSSGLRAQVEKPLYRIGAHETNDLVLADETVSQHHLELSVALRMAIEQVDLSSSNGTFLGSVRLSDVTIVEPVTLQLGNSSLRISPATTEKEVPASSRGKFGSVLGRSVVMRELFEQLEAVSASECSVLIEGETGSGKEQVAESIHNESARKDGAFVVVDCGALSGELLESELFGHAKGAFTGAIEERKGLMQVADGGTVFLDEVGELPLALQAKLLGAIERRKVTPIGTSTPRAVDIRVLAATNRNLAREVNEGRFRADLFYRLAVVRLRVPPLRDRLEDIPILVEHFLDVLREREGEHIAQHAVYNWTWRSWRRSHEVEATLRELHATPSSAALKLGEAPAGGRRRRPSSRAEPFMLPARE